MTNQYPQINAGSRITAALLMSMLPVEIRKPSQTARTSTTTYADDPDLTFELAANAVYWVEFIINYATPGPAGTAGFKTAWTVPSGATGNRYVNGPGDSQNDGNANNISGRFGTHAFTTAIGYGSRGTSTTSGLGVREWCVVNTTSGGTCALQWAQQTSNASATTIFADSLMRVRRMA